MEQGNEPSVEEILRSIKRVIAENEDLRPVSRPAPKSPRIRPASASTAAMASGREGRESDAEILDLSELDMAPHSDSIAAEDAPAPSSPAASSTAASSSDALLADEAAQSVRHSLAALAAMSQPGARPQIVRSGETSLEGMVRDMLRPMLKEWLDANLPDMVESAIAAEIARLRG